MSAAEKNPVTAIDILLKPDGVMVQRALAANARLRETFPNGFAFDDTHHPHLTLVQQFVRTDHLDKVFAAANAVFARENPTGWTLKAVKLYVMRSPPIGPASIEVEPTNDLRRLQDELVAAVQPYTATTWTPAAFFSDGGGRDIQQFLIDSVANFATVAAGKNFGPHVTVGVGTEAALDAMLAEPFEPFAFSAVGASVYQLGTFGTARKELLALTTAP